MRYKLLGGSGLRVSELALGTMTLSRDNPWGWGVEAEASAEILDAYADAGGNFIDTANNYTDGQSETVIGDYLADRRDEFVLASKYTLHDPAHPQDPNAGGNHRKNLRRTVADSLERLQTDYLDLLYLHVWDYTTPVEEVMSTLNHLVESGTVHYLGVSDTPAWVVATANRLAAERGWEPFVAYQFPYNLGRRAPEREIMPFCRYTDLAMTTWSVLGSGLYTGKYTRGSAGSGRLADDDLDEHDLEVARLVDEIADDHGVSSSQVAIAWAGSTDQQLFPIVGATSAEHVEEAVGSLDVELGGSDLDRLDEATCLDPEFPQSFVGADHVQSLIHGETADRLDNHRFHGY